MGTSGTGRTAALGSARAQPWRRRCTRERTSAAVEKLGAPGVVVAGGVEGGAVGGGLGDEQGGGAFLVQVRHTVHVRR
eukprot:scaffold7204_cov354-Prasinococcus_capsulatus_cf.AAC.6